MERPTIETAHVLEQFCRISGCGAKEATRWLIPAKVCTARLAARLKPDAKGTEHEEALALAAAGMLFYQYAAATAAGDGDVKLGELSVGNAAAGVEQARCLRDELLAGVAHLLMPGNTFLVQTGRTGV